MVVTTVFGVIHTWHPNTWGISRC